eukprot:10630112-Karenia_brevis.AAC.1
MDWSCVPFKVVKEDGVEICKGSMLLGYVCIHSRVVMSSHPYCSSPQVALALWIEKTRDDDDDDDDGDDDDD